MLIGLLAAAGVGTTASAQAAPRATPARVDFGRAVMRTDPSALGVCSSTYGDTPLSSAAQRQAERRLDARSVRIPVAFRNGRITTFARGTDGTLDVPALVRLYRSWGYRVLVVCGGRTHELDIQPGDATRIMRALGFDGIEYTSPNEPGNHGRSIEDAIKWARMICDEGRALNPEFKVWGPVWAYYDRDALRRFAEALGDRLAGLDYHHYAMGTKSLSTAEAMRQTPTWGQEVRELRADLTSLGREPLVNVDELNFSWRYEDGTPGGNKRFFTAVNTVWMASTLGHILASGGRAMPYATQNGPLGVMIEAGNTNPDNRPASSPMPAYWGIAAWTGAHVWPHYNDTFYDATVSDEWGTIETFAVNNEAGGYNIVIINKSETAAGSMALDIRGAGSGTYDLHQNDPNRPYDQPARVAQGDYTATNAVSLSLPPMTVSVLVLKPATASDAP